MLVGMSLALLYPVQSAVAQDAQAATDDDRAIIVTAQHRSEALEDVPMTVTVLSPETLSANNVSGFRDLANITSGLMINNSGSGPNAAIRGVTTINAGSYENNAALFVDGLVVGRRNARTP